MFNSIYKKLEYHFHNPNYLYFFISLILLIILPPLSLLFKGGFVLLNLAFGLVLLMAVIFVTTNLKEVRFFGIIAVITFVLFVLRDLSTEIRFFNALLAMLFFIWVFWKLVQYFLRTKIVDTNGVLACVSGYLVLGIIATSLFYVVDESCSSAFQFPAEPSFSDFIYFSYVTLTTIGYGDIIPLHPIAKSSTILISILGELYLTFVVAIIVGKYIALERDNSKS